MKQDASRLQREVVHFPEWRLSEDLDFTIMQEVDPQSLKHAFEQVFLSVSKRSSIVYSFSAFNTGEYAIFADVQFLGPIQVVPILVP